ncbi:MAG: nucleotidyltransferase domain-containing protein [Anaerolineales bacterium]|nr:nucleotidyltransferase domain-containing protein [Anaerolineales bacterium]
MDIALQIPTKALSDFCRRNQITKLALFGSVLTEQFGPESDVDVLVTFAPEAHIGFMALSRIKRELSALFKKPVDLITPDGLKANMREGVLKSAKVVYAAG